MTERLLQRLSVVWFKDLVGYSGLSARDHDQAVELVQRFQETIRRTIPHVEGRIVKFQGDAVMVESPSAEAALRAASAVHAHFGDEIRTGIHLGDVAVAADGDLYGDGQEFVNQFTLCWLYCSDEVVQLGNSFVQTLKASGQDTVAAKDDALAKLMGAIRKDLLSRKVVRRTKLTGDEFQRLASLRLNPSIRRVYACFMLFGLALWAGEP